MDIDEPAPAKIDHQAEHQQQQSIQLSTPLQQQAGKKLQSGNKSRRKKRAEQRQQRLGYPATAEQPAAETDEEDAVGSESGMQHTVTKRRGNQEWCAINHV
jgi:hypothetical protein